MHLFGPLVSETIFHRIIKKVVLR